MLRRSLCALLAASTTACGGARLAKEPSVPPASAPVTEVTAPQTPEEHLAAIREAYSAGRYSEGLKLVQLLLEASPDKVLAYDRVGSIYFALRRDAEALGMWETALALEKDAKRKADLAASVALARRSLGLPEPKPEPAATPVKPPPPARKRDPAAAEKLYREGVAKYAGGEYLAATTLFMKALDADPGHEAARKALERLRLRAP